MNGGRELQRLRTLHVFAGAGGGILGDVLSGHQPVCAVEIDEYCQQVLSARQKDGCFPWFPIFADVKTFDGRPWRGLVDCVSGGFPCQDISPAGKGAGITGERSGLWSEMARIIRDVGPRFVLVENSSMLVSRGLGTVLGDLASLGYDAEWCVLGADDAGAPHIRKRIWILAYSQQAGLEELGGVAGESKESEPRHGSALANAPQHGRLARGSGDTEGIEERREPDRGGVDADVAYAVQGGLSKPEHEPRQERPTRASVGACSACNGWWSTEPDVGRVAHGVAARVDRLKAIGNGQVPAVAELAWRTLYERITN